MESNLSGDTVIEDSVDKQPILDEEGWEELQAPVDDLLADDYTVSEVEPSQTISDNDERAELEAELAKIDASWQHRSEPLERKVDSALKDLESKLSDLDM
jgi:hypothetical protein